MKRILAVIVAIPFAAGAASAAELLDDSQLDRVVAGDVPQIYCPTCIVASSSSTSLNGITVTTSMTTLPPMSGDGGSNSGGDMGGTGGDTGGTGGDTGGSGGSGGDTGGDTGGNGGTNNNNVTVIGGGGGGGGTSGSVVVSPPASFVANLVRSAGFNPVSP